MCGEASYATLDPFRNGVEHNSFEAVLRAARRFDDIDVVLKFKADAPLHFVFKDF